MIDLTDCHHWISKFQIFKVHSLLNGIENQSGHANLEESGCLTNIRIAANDVKTPVLTRISQWLIAGVNNRPRTRCRRGDGFPHLFRSLGEAVIKLGPLPAQMSRTNKDQARDKERDEPVRNLSEISTTMQKIVFMATKTIAL